MCVEPQGSQQKQKRAMCAILSVSFRCGSGGEPVVSFSRSTERQSHFSGSYEWKQVPGNVAECSLPVVRKRRVPTPGGPPPSSGSRGRGVYFKIAPGRPPPLPSSAGPAPPPPSSPFPACLARTKMAGQGARDSRADAVSPLGWLGGRAPVTS